MKRALITGITGQTGSYLADLLNSKGYEVHGIVRRSSTINTSRIDHLYDDDRVHLHYGDLSDATGLSNLMMDIEPDHVYNMAAQSHVKVSFETPIYTVDIVGTGALRMLEATRNLNKKKEVRFYQASSSEMFGSAKPPQSESTPFAPRSPYACAKVMAHQLATNYREAYGMFVCNGILFNHESPRRGETFVTRKITKAAARISCGRQDELVLGNLASKRDWGHAKDYAEAIFLMMTHDTPDDYVVATGETHSVQDFLEEAFERVNLDHNEYVRIDQKYFRPTEVDVLKGDSSKIREELGWEPKIDFKGLVTAMILQDLGDLQLHQLNK